MGSTALLITSARAQTNDSPLIVRGAVEQPLKLTLADLQAMPRTKFTTHEKDGAETMFEGVALHEIILRAKPQLTDTCCSNAINTVVVIKAADKYQAVFSLPELDPKFARREIFLADHRDGQLLKPPHGPLEVIVPDEAVHARWVRQVNVIEVLPIGERHEGATNSLPP